MIHVPFPFDSDCRDSLRIVLRWHLPALAGWAPWLLGSSARRSSVSQEERYQSQSRAEVRSEFDLAHRHFGHDAFWTSLLHLAMTNFETCL